MTKISIILPVFNSEKYLRRCLDALANQTYSNIEILCINDGSTDNSLEILNEYSNKDSRFRVFSQENSGPAKSRNVGLENMTGEYLMFCDSDDWYEPNMCEVMINTMLENDVDFACCESNVFVENAIKERKQSINWHKNYSNKKGKLKIHKRNTEITVLLWNKIFKTSKIKKYNIKFPNGLESDDNCFIYEYIAFSDNVFFLKKPLYNYVIRENSIMDNYFRRISKNHLFDRVKIIVELYNFLKTNKKENTYKVFLLSLYIKQINCLWDLTTKEEKEECLDILSNLTNKFDYKFSKNSFFYMLKQKELSAERVSEYLNKSSYLLICGKVKWLLLNFKNTILFIPQYLKFFRG